MSDIDDLDRVAAQRALNEKGPDVPADEARRRLGIPATNVERAARDLLAVLGSPDPLQLIAGHELAKALGVEGDFELDPMARALHMFEAARGWKPDWRLGPRPVPTEEELWARLFALPLGLRQKIRDRLAADEHVNLGFKARIDPPTSS